MPLFSEHNTDVSLHAWTDQTGPHLNGHERICAFVSHLVDTAERTSPQLLLFDKVIRTNLEGLNAEFIMSAKYIHMIGLKAIVYERTKLTSPEIVTTAAKSTSGGLKRDRDCYKTYAVPTTLLT